MKYQLTKTTREFEGITLYRIRALTSFGTVKAGELGGWVMNLSNLSQFGTCWIFDEAVCCGRGLVQDHARVLDRAVIRDGAIVKDYASVKQHATVKHDAVVAGHAEVSDLATVWGNAKIRENASVFDQASVGEFATVEGHAQVLDQAKVVGEALVFHGALVREQADVSGDPRIGGHARVGRTCTMTPIYIMGAEYHITMYDDTMSIGCLTKSREEWGQLTADQMHTNYGGQERLNTHELWSEFAETLLTYWDLEMNRLRKSAGE